MLYAHVPAAAVVMLAVTAPHAQALVPLPSAAQQQAMFAAVRQMLTQARVQPQDLPKKIISVEPMGTDQYKVHMEMVQGDGWFILKWDGQKWTATGLNQ